MNRKLLFFVSVFIGLIMTLSLSVQAQVPECQLRGNDIFVPDEVIQTITNFDPKKPVYAACNLNGWLIDPMKVTKSILERTEMIKARDGSWCAKNMRGERFNAAQLKESGNYSYKNINWAQLQMFKDASWLKTEGGNAIYLN
jgi:hypothetical protein